MVLDSSALVAIQFAEPGHEQLMERIRNSSFVIVAAPTVLETVIVLSTRYGVDAAMLLDHALRRLRVEVAPFRTEHYSVAAAAYFRYGKGRHPAALNYGDCMAYAMASVSRMPLLYVGRDFAKTDIPAA